MRTIQLLLAAALLASAQAQAADPFKHIEGGACFQGFAYNEPGVFCTHSHKPGDRMLIAKWKTPKGCTAPWSDDGKWCIAKWKVVPIKVEAKE